MSSVKRPLWGGLPWLIDRLLRVWQVAVWVMTCISSLLGLVVLGTAALMTGDGGAILGGLILWAIGVALSIIGVHSIVRRSTAALAVLPLAAPCVLAFLIARFILGVEI